MAAMPGSWRSYTEAERAAAVGRALAVGTKKAAAELGIPRRTLSSWLQRPTAEVQAAIEMTRTELVGKVWKGLGAAVTSLEAALSHPDASKPENAHKTAQAADTLMRIYQLQTGGATARNANVNVNMDADEMTDSDRAYLARYLDTVVAASPEERAAYAPRLVAALLELPQEAGNG